MGNHDSTINEWIDQNRNQILDILRRLIKIPSDSGKETAICNTIEAMYQDLGFNPQRVSLTREQMKAHQGYIDTTQFGSPNNFTGRENVVVKIQGTGGGRSLILNAHLDTIPVEDEKSWAHDPFGGEVIGNKIYGRGAADCKTGVVLAFIVARILKECHIDLLGDILIQNVVEEEFGGLGTLQCALSGQKSDGAIILENTGNKIVVVGGRGEIGREHV